MQTHDGEEPCSWTKEMEFFSAHKELAQFIKSMCDENPSKRPSLDVAERQIESFIKWDDLCSMTESAQLAPDQFTAIEPRGRLSCPF